jgi:hypothetical protein
MKKNAKTVSAIIIATILSITVLLSAGEAKADPEIQTDWQASHYGFYGGYDAFSRCDHTNWQYPDDCATLLGIYAGYRDTLPPVYDYVSWDFRAQAGYGGDNDYVFYGDLHCSEQRKDVGDSSYHTNNFDYQGIASYDEHGQWYIETVRDYSYQSPFVASVSGESSCTFRNPYTGHYIYLTTAPYQALTASTSINVEGKSCVKVNHDADVSATGAGIYDLHSNINVHADCADDCGTYYCYITDVYHNTPSSTNHIYHDYDGQGYGSDMHSYDVPIYNIETAHHVIINTAPYLYDVTFNYYAYNPTYVEDYTFVYSDVQQRVAWEEVGGGEYYYGAGPTINDPWGDGADAFQYAIARNWGGESETTFTSLPLQPWTFVWGNTVDIFYAHSSAPPTYATWVNVWLTMDGYYFEYCYSYLIYEPAGWNYLDFGPNFISAYDHQDATSHYSNPDWYDLGTGTTLDVGWWY